MNISKQDALNWFSFFASLPEDETLMTYQQEIVYAVFAQIERALDERNRQRMQQIKGLKSLSNRTLYIGDDARFPRGCRSCLTGTGLSAIRKTNKCNIACQFCYNYGELDQIAPVGEGLFEIGGTKFYEKDLDLLLSMGNKPTGVSYVYLEPFMEIEKYYFIIQKFNQADIHQHLYTNGLLATEDTLKALGDAGLDEIRFNLGASNCADKVISLMAIAKKYIPQVGIETPMTPEFLDTFMEKKQAILSTGIDFINCAELHLNPNNLNNYEGENMYISRHGYISPIWSRDITWTIMQMADTEKWKTVVHDCSNDTKFARDLHLKSKEGGWFGASNYACEFPQIPYAAFLPILSDSNFQFLVEEKLPAGYNPGEIML